MASTAPGSQVASSRANSERFSSTSSGAASITSRSPPSRRSSSPAPGESRGSPRLPPRRSSGHGRRPWRGRRADRSEPAVERLGLSGSWSNVSKPPRAGELRDPGAHRPGARDSDAARSRSPAAVLRACASPGRPASPRRGPRSPSRARTGAAPARARRQARSPRRRAPPAWRAARRAAGARRSAAASSSAAVEPLALAGDLVDDPHLPAASCGVEAPPGQHQLHRPLLADRARQALGAAAARG